MSGLAGTDYSLILNNHNRGIQSLLEVVNSHGAAVGMRSKASKANVVSAVIPRKNAWSADT